MDGPGGLLLALDGLHIVQNRIAMLAIFLTTFITAGMLLLVLDRKRTWVGHPGREGLAGRVERIFGSPYRLGAGLAFGAAVATKWAGVFALIFAAGLCTAWVMKAPETDDRSRWKGLGTGGRLVPHRPLARVPGSATVPSSISMARRSASS